MAVDPNVLVVCATIIVCSTLVFVLFSKGGSSKKQSIATKYLYYKQVVEIPNSKRDSGIRKNIFACAGSNFGFSDSMNEISIRYNGDDLYCSILFDSLQDVRRFREDVSGMIATMMLENVKLESIVEISYDTPQHFPIIEKLMYRGEDASSHDVTSSVTSSHETVCSINSNPLCVLQMIEDSTIGFICDVDLVRCHLISSERITVDESLKDYETDENKFLYMSWPMHQRFDGIYDGIPKIAIRFESVVGPDIGTLNGHEYNRTKVSIVIECRHNDTRTAAAIQQFLKQHTTNNSKTQFIMFVSVLDPDKFKFCLETKYNETTAIWNGGPNLNEQKALRQSLN